MGIQRNRPADDDQDDYRPSRTATATRERDEDEDGFEEDTPEVGAGWGAAKKVMSETSTFTDSFKFPDKDNGEDAALIKFPEDEPFASYAQHWVDEISKGKKSFTCLGRNCALCARGHKPRALIVFNVIDVNDGRVYPLEAGPMLAKILEAENDDKAGPLSRPYYSVYKSGGGKKGRVSYSVKPVKPRDLEDDYGLDPEVVATKVRNASKDLLDKSWVKFPKVEELREIAEEYLTD